MRSVVTILLIIVLIVGGVWWWRTYHSGNQYDGSVVRRDAAMENGTTTMENGQNIGDEAHPTPSRSDAPGTINGDPVNANSYDLGTQTTPITQDPYAAGSRGGQQPQPTSRNAPNAPKISYNSNPRDPRAPITDSEAPDAPNGLRFGGSGMYQWYRQGDITYRTNTQTGTSCIMYATLEEWRKPYVSRNGCRNY